MDGRLDPARRDVAVFVGPDEVPAAGSPNVVRQPRPPASCNRPNSRIEAFKRMLEFLRELSRRDADARRMLTLSDDLKGPVRMA